MYIGSHVHFTHLPPVVTSYITVLQYQNQEINFGALLLTRLQTSLTFHHFLYTFVCVCICECI